MSCRASVVVTTDDTDAGASLAASAVRRLQQLERRWSRFLPASEVSGLNAAGGRPCRVSPDTVRLVERLVQAWHATEGAFDPTLLGTIVELGYATSRERNDRTTSFTHPISPRGRAADVLVDPSSQVVELPLGTALDPGGLGKGLAADIVVEELLAAGAHGALVEIGGDVRVAGRPPSGTAWPIAIEDTGEIVDVADGGIATSTPRLRTWSTDGVARHHLIDPNTLLPSTVDVVSCTVLAGTAAWAEAFTKLAFVDGRAALDHYEERSLAASITTSAGTIVTSTWKEFLR
jgi:thiamine biosynthesis lipoprotein